jgi:hypothetical protein
LFVDDQQAVAVRWGVEKIDDRIYGLIQWKILAVIMI